MNHLFVAPDAGCRGDYVNDYNNNSWVLYDKTKPNTVHSHALTQYGMFDRQQYAFRSFSLYHSTYGLTRSPAIAGIADRRSTDRYYPDYGCVLKN